MDNWINRVDYRQVSHLINRNRQFLAILKAEVPDLFERKAWIENMAEEQDLFLNRLAEIVGPPNEFPSPGLPSPQAWPGRNSIEIFTEGLDDLAARFAVTMRDKLNGGHTYYERHDDELHVSLVVDLIDSLDANDPAAVAAYAAYAWQHGWSLNIDNPRREWISAPPVSTPTTGAAEFMPVEMVIIYTWRETSRGADGQARRHTINYGEFAGSVYRDEGQDTWSATVKGGPNAKGFGSDCKAQEYVQNTIQGMIAKRVTAARETLALYHPSGDGFAVE